MDRVVIGIRGLNNKPPRKVLERWWKLCLRDGLSIFGKPRLNFTFKLIYWADILHLDPLNPKLTDKNDPFSPLRKKLLDTFEFIVDSVFYTKQGFINYDKISDKIIQHLFRDLDTYYYRNCIDRKKKSASPRYPARGACQNALEIPA